MKKILFISILLVTSTTFADSNTDLIKKWEQSSNHTKTTVLDAADVVIAYYYQKDPEFTASTYIALLCAKESSQLPMFAEKLIQIRTRARLYMAISGIRVQKNDAQKTQQQMDREYEDQKNKSIHDFFSEAILSLTNSQAINECYKSRVR
jgi:hypothetical protein